MDNQRAMLAAADFSDLTAQKTMKPTDELRQDLRKLARSNAEIAEIVAQIDDRRITWERGALHLLCSLYGDSRPQNTAKKAVKTAEKG